MPLTSEQLRKLREDLENVLQTHKLIGINNKYFYPLIFMIQDLRSDEFLTLLKETDESKQTKAKELKEHGASYSTRSDESNF